jgi:hypothetical protein
MSKFKKIVILSMVLFLLTGCAPQLKNGTVIIVKKEYHEPYTTTTFTRVGKAMIPIRHHHDEEYKVIVKQFDDKDEYIEKGVKVDKQLYDKVKVGDELTYKSGGLFVNSDEDGK